MERPTGKPDDRVGTPDLDKKPTDSPWEGGNNGKDKEKRSVKSHHGHRGGKGGGNHGNKGMDNSVTSIADDPTVPGEIDRDDKSKNSTGRDQRKKHKDLGDPSSDSEGSGEDDNKGKMKNKLVLVDLHEDEGEIDHHGKPKKPEHPTEEIHVELDEHGKLKKKPEDEEAMEEEEDQEKTLGSGEGDQEDGDVELDEHGKLKMAGGEGDQEGEHEGKEDNENESDEEDHENGHDKKKEEDLPLERNARQTNNMIPLIDILTAVHLPDLCMERRCCDGESCFVRRIAENLPPLAFCAPVSSLDTSRSG